MKFQKLRLHKMSFLLYYDGRMFYVKSYLQVLQATIVLRQSAEPESIVVLEDVLQATIVLRQTIYLQEVKTCL